MFQVTIIAVVIILIITAFLLNLKFYHKSHSVHNIYFFLDFIILLNLYLMDLYLKS